MDDIITSYNTSDHKLKDGKLIKFYMYSFYTTDFEGITYSWSDATTFENSMINIKKKLAQKYSKNIVALQLDYGSATNRSNNIYDISKGCAIIKTGTSMKFNKDNSDPRLGSYKILFSEKHMVMATTLFTEDNARIIPMYTNTKEDTRALGVVAKNIKTKYTAEYLITGFKFHKLVNSDIINIRNKLTNMITSTFNFVTSNDIEISFTNQKFIITVFIQDTEHSKPNLLKINDFFTQRSQEEGSLRIIDILCVNSNFNFNIDMNIDLLHLVNTQILDITGESIVKVSNRVHVLCYKFVTNTEFAKFSNVVKILIFTFVKEQFITNIDKLSFINVSLTGVNIIVSLEVVNNKNKVFVIEQLDQFFRSNISRQIKDYIYGLTNQTGIKVSDPIDISPHEPKPLNILSTTISYSIAEFDISSLGKTTCEFIKAHLLNEKFISRIKNNIKNLVINILNNEIQFTMDVSSEFINDVRTSMGVNDVMHAKTMANIIVVCINNVTNYNLSSLKVSIPVEYTKKREFLSSRDPLVNNVNNNYDNKLFISNKDKKQEKNTSRQSNCENILSQIAKFDSINKLESVSLNTSKIVKNIYTVSGLNLETDIIEGGLLFISYELKQRCSLELGINSNFVNVKCCETSIIIQIKSTTIDIITRVNSMFYGIDKYNTISILKETIAKRLKNNSQNTLSILPPSVSIKESELDSEMSNISRNKHKEPGIYSFLISFSGINLQLPSCDLILLSTEMTSFVYLGLCKCMSITRDDVEFILNDGSYEISITVTDINDLFTRKSLANYFSLEKTNELNILFKDIITMMGIGTSVKKITFTLTLEICVDLIKMIKCKTRYEQKKIISNALTEMFISNGYDDFTLEINYLNIDATNVNFTISVKNTIISSDLIYFIESGDYISIFDEKLLAETNLSNKPKIISNYIVRVREISKPITMTSVKEICLMNRVSYQKIKLLDTQKIIFMNKDYNWTLGYVNVADRKYDSKPFGSSSFTAQGALSGSITTSDAGIGIKEGIIGVEIGNFNFQNINSGTAYNSNGEVIKPYLSSWISSNNFGVAFCGIKFKKIQRIFGFSLKGLGSEYISDCNVQCRQPKKRHSGNHKIQITVRDPSDSVWDNIDDNFEKIWIDVDGSFNDRTDGERFYWKLTTGISVTGIRLLVNPINGNGSNISNDITTNIQITNAICVSDFQIFGLEPDA